MLIVTFQLLSALAPTGKVVVPLLSIVASKCTKTSNGSGERLCGRSRLLDTFRHHSKTELQTAFIVSLSLAPLCID